MAETSEDARAVREAASKRMRGRAYADRYHGKSVQPVAVARGIEARNLLDVRVKPTGGEPFW